MFDGGSIFLYCTTVVMYLYSVIPNLATQFTTLPSHKLNAPFPRSLRIPTLELASNNLVCSVALTGVLALQAGRWWAERADSDDEQVAIVIAEKDAEDAKRKRRKEKGPANLMEKTPKRQQKRRAQS